MDMDTMMDGYGSDGSGSGSDGNDSDGSDGSFLDMDHNDLDFEALLDASGTLQRPPPPPPTRLPSQIETDRNRSKQPRS